MSTVQPQVWMCVQAPYTALWLCVQRDVNSNLLLFVFVYVMAGMSIIAKNNPIWNPKNCTGICVSVSDRISFLWEYKWWKCTRCCRHHYSVLNAVTIQNNIFLLLLFVWPCDGSKTIFKKRMKKLNRTVEFGVFREKHTFHGDRRTFLLKRKKNCF